MSDTPQTDAAIQRSCIDDLKCEWVEVGFARKLEHDLKIANNWMKHHQDHVDDLIKENAALRAEVDQWASRCAAAIWMLPETVTGGELRAAQDKFHRERENLRRENAALREKDADWENAVLHARDHRCDEAHCTCVTPFLGKINQLERENAALRGALEQAEDALRHALIMSPLDPFQRGKVISAAIDVARAALNAARREGTP